MLDVSGSFMIAAMVVVVSLPEIALMGGVPNLIFRVVCAKGKTNGADVKNTALSDDVSNL